jgi:catechol 2,3-dioxygenase-like lactoylglutathione lyase family enzyme
MSTTTAVRSSEATRNPSVGQVDMKLEVIVIPVSDVERASAFYARLGWRLDADFTKDGEHVFQFTPPGSQCSVHFGTNQTPVAPGSVQNSFLVVSDIHAARADLVARGIDVSEVFHYTGFNRTDARQRVSGRSPDWPSYGSFVSFSDPDGNGWLVQEVTKRLPGRIEPAATSFGSASDLASALRRAAAAHGEHEKRTGSDGRDWPDWYAAYLVAEQAGAQLPS